MRQNDQPRISLNQLAEYLESNPSKRKQIVFDAKYPQAFKYTRYTEARDILKKFFINNRDQKVINDGILALNRKKTSSEFQENDKKNSIELLQLVREADLSFFDSFEVSANDKMNSILEISGVGISVYPDIQLSKIQGNKLKFGLLKFQLRKTNNLNLESLKIVATVLYKYATEILAVDVKSLDYKMCIAFDAFNLNIETAPRSYALRLKRIEAACEEIALRWDNL